MILMPVFNERDTIERAIADALGADLPIAGRQLVIVDDGSTDGTCECLAAATQNDGPWVDLHSVQSGERAHTQRGRATTGRS